MSSRRSHPKASPNRHRPGPHPPSSPKADAGGSADAELARLERLQSYEILDTQAELCNALDDCQGAIDLIKLALAEDPDSEYYQKQLARFEELLAQKQ